MPRQPLLHKKAMPLNKQEHRGRNYPGGVQDTRSGRKNELTDASGFQSLLEG